MFRYHDTKWFYLKFICVEFRYTVEHSYGSARTYTLSKLSLNYKKQKIVQGMVSKDLIYLFDLT